MFSPHVDSDDLGRRLTRCSSPFQALGNAVQELKENEKYSKKATNECNTAVIKSAAFSHLNVRIIPPTFARTPSRRKTSLNKR